MLNINNETVCVIPDAHQNIEWIKDVLRIEKSVDRFVFLGDMFDSHFDFPIVAGIRNTAAFYASLIEDPRCIVLWGNHDVSYMEDCRYAVRRFKNHKRLQKCSGFTRSKSEEIAKEVTWAHWLDTEPFVMVNGWLLSHAGVSEKLLHSNLTIEENLTHLYHASLTAREEINIRHSIPFYNSHIRAGDDDYSGFIWQDFQEEFEDISIRQIVGHTPAKRKNKVQQIGMSYCIDAHQSTYVVLHANNRLELKTTDSTEEVRIDNIDSWIETRNHTTNVNLLSKNN